MKKVGIIGQEELKFREVNIRWMSKQLFTAGGRRIGGCSSELKVRFVGEKREPEDHAVTRDVG